MRPDQSTTRPADMSSRFDLATAVREATPRRTPVWLKRLLISTVACLPLVVVAADSPSVKRQGVVVPGTAAMAPNDIKVIRSVGRALLGVRQGAASEPKREALKQHVKALGAELDQALKVLVNAPPVFHAGRMSVATDQPAQSAVPPTSNLIRTYRLASQLPDGTVLPAEEMPSVPAATNRLPADVVVAPSFSGTETSDVRREAIGRVQGQLDELRKLNEVLATQPDIQASSSDPLLPDVRALREEIQTAVNNGTPEDLVALARLRDRLMSRLPIPVSAVQPRLQDVPPSAPAIATIVRHR